MLITIVGAGWSGCHLACELAACGCEVTLLEQGSQLLAGTSGLFGIRLHKGPHYPRSPATRENCRKSFDKFLNKYRELVVDHESSIYALGNMDSDGFPSKTSLVDYHRVCHETPDCQKVEPLDLDLADTQNAYTFDEPSIAIGPEVRGFFRQRLEQLGVRVILQTKVLYVGDHPCRKGCKGKPLKLLRSHYLGDGESVSSLCEGTSTSDVVINCTGFQALFPEESSVRSALRFEFPYQPCLALRYRDKTPTSSKPISLIFMDGWFPCLMPAISKIDSGTPYRDYILTHGAYTILGSFSARFEYQGWYGCVLAKPKCPTEFRSGFTFEYGGVIHVFPGKIGNVIDVGEEVLALLGLDGSRGGKVVDQGACRCVEHGIFHQAQAELGRSLRKGERSTANLQTFKEILETGQ